MSFPRCRSGKIVLTAAVLAALSLPARADVIVHRDVIAKLSENNIRAFLEEVEGIANGQRPGMSADDITNYFTTHVADDAKFGTILHYELSNQPAQDTTLTMDKPKYIEVVLKGQGSMKDYQSSIDIQSVDISTDGKSAALKTVTKEKGKLVMPGKDAATPNLIPVAGESLCDETVVLSTSNYIQMKSANCRTFMRLDMGNIKLPPSQQ